MVFVSCGFPHPLPPSSLDGTCEEQRHGFLFVVGLPECMRVYGVWCVFVTMMMTMMAGGRRDDGDSGGASFFLRSGGRVVTSPTEQLAR